jgi:hypothetical protein
LLLWAAASVQACSSCGRLPLCSANGSRALSSMHYERAPRFRRSWMGRRLRSAALCRASLRDGGASSLWCKSGYLKQKLM